MIYHTGIHNNITIRKSISIFSWFPFVHSLICVHWRPRFWPTNEKTWCLCRRWRTAAAALQHHRVGAQHIFMTCNEVDLWSLGGISWKGHPGFVGTILECFSIPPPPPHTHTHRRSDWCSWESICSAFKSYHWAPSSAVHVRRFSSRPGGRAAEKDSRRVFRAQGSVSP